MQNFPHYLTRATLLRRINRFVADVLINDLEETVYVPNTGRLSELALPYAEVLLSPIKGKFRYKILYIINSDFPVMIDSTYSNRLFQELILNKKVPSLEEHTLIKREPAYGNHRFDFLLVKDNKNLFVELKSCTLFHKKTASFPDAVSQRASQHIEALAKTGEGLIIFFILKSGMKKFIPNYHTDFRFYLALRNNSEKVKIRALSIEYDETLRINALKDIPVIIPEVKPQGIFIILMYLHESIKINNAADDVLDKGYYLLCDDDKENIFKAVAKIRRVKTGIFLNMKIITDIPVVTTKLKVSDAKSMLINNGGIIIRINNLDNNQALLYFAENPAEKKWFWNEIMNLRFGAL